MAKKQEKQPVTTAFAQAGVLNREQLASELQVIPLTITSWEAQGMPSLPMGRKTRLYDVQEVIGWLKKQRGRRR